MRRLTTQIARGWLAVAFCTVNLAAQQTTSVSGVVHSRRNSPIAGAEVVLVGNERSETKQLRSDNLGRFEFTNVPAGQYTILARRLGYEQVVRNVSVPTDSGRVEMILEDFGTALNQRIQRQREAALARARARPRRWHCETNRAITAEKARDWLWLAGSAIDELRIPSDTARFLREFRPITDSSECARVGRNADSSYGLISDTLVVFRVGNGYLFPELRALANETGRIFTVFVSQ